MTPIPDPSGRALARAATGAGVLAVLVAAASASLLESITLAAAALYQLALLLLHGPRLRPALRIALAVALLAPAPFLIGAAIHALTHVQAFSPLSMVPAVLSSLLAALLRGLLARRRQGGDGVDHPAVAPPAPAQMLAPGMTTLCAAAALGAGAWQADAVIGIGLLLAMLFGLLGRHLLQAGSLLD